MSGTGVGAKARGREGAIEMSLEGEGVGVTLAGGAATWLPDLPGFESWKTLAESPDRSELLCPCHGAQHPPMQASCQWQEEGTSRTTDGPRAGTWDPSGKVRGSPSWGQAAWRRGWA